jgi:LysR family hydrogen peroxide-inducible transcriptional activator
MSLRALAEHGNFSRAAEAVHITQPALSMQIMELEASLGVSLVTRKPVGLTRAGRVALAHADRIAAELRALDASMRRGSGQLNLGIIPTIAPYVLPKALPQLQIQFDSVRLREAQTESLLADLAEGRIDAALIATPAPDYDEIILVEDRFVLAGRRDVLEQSQGLAPESLDPMQLLLLDEGHCLADQALTLCGLSRSARSIDLGAASLATLCGLVGQGLGITLLPEIAIATELRGTPTITLSRFKSEPSRILRLVRGRNAEADESWFERLATTLSNTCNEIINSARS